MSRSAKDQTTRVEFFHVPKRGWGGVRAAVMHRGLRGRHALRLERSRTALCKFKGKHRCLSFVLVPRFSIGSGGWSCTAGVESPRSLVGNPLQGHIEAVLVVQAVPANGSDLTVRTDQKLDVAHVLGEAHILKDEHVVHQPVFLEEIAVGVAAVSQSWLLSHGGEEQLSAREKSSPWLQHPRAATLAQHRLPVPALG